MRDDAQGRWPMDVEVVSAMMTRSSFAFMVVALSVFWALALLVGPVEQHPSAAWVIITSSASLLPMALSTAFGKLHEFFTPKGEWVRAIDFVLAPLAVCGAAATAPTDVPVTMLYLFATAMMWPTQHPRNAFASASLLAMPLLLRWLLVPGATPFSLLLMVPVGLVAMALYEWSARHLDRYRATRRIVKHRQQALETATAAQRAFRLAMSVHDGLSGLAAVAEARVKKDVSVVRALSKRIDSLLEGVGGASAVTGIAELQHTAQALGLTVDVHASGLQSWDPVSAGDLLEMLTELLSNGARHGAEGASSGRIHIDTTGAVVELRTTIPPAFSSAGRGLRNLGQRIAAYGGGLEAKVHGHRFEVRAQIPNRRVAYAPPFLQVLGPSAAAIFFGGAAWAVARSWHFAWPHLGWYALVVVVHLTQLEHQSREQRAAGERAEAALLELQLDEQRALIRERLGAFRESLTSEDALSLAQTLAALRVELRALLFALEWQGSPAELSRELEVSVPSTMRVGVVHRLALTAFQRRVAPS